ncbi:MAG: hypothetical protein GEV10_24600 [Streptosporangiales bacterium]|nr:hypothetical protein [Streptosporangiales bacterium]
MRESARAQEFTIEVDHGELDVLIGGLRGAALHRTRAGADRDETPYPAMRQATDRLLDVRAASSGTRPPRITLSHDELMAIGRCLGDAMDAMDAAEFASVVGCSLDDAGRVLKSLSNITGRRDWAA